LNPFGLDATGLMVWGLVAHLVADWLLQNDAMATRKANLKDWPGYLHASIHGALLAFVFGWVSIPLAVAHLLIDTRIPVAWWSSLIRQTQPTGVVSCNLTNRNVVPVVDIGMFVRFWNDQVWHIACIAVAALVVA
jgi:hypothetical protein